jgi:exosome complex component RRP41
LRIKANLKKDKVSNVFLERIIETAMQNADILALAGLRTDGRRPEDVRTVKFKFGVVPLADGSVYYEQGLNKVVVMIHGPQDSSGGSGSGDAGLDDRGILKVHIENSPFSGTERKTRRIGDRRTAEMETVLKQTLDEIVLVNLYPKSEINIVVHILETDGSVLCAVLNAACLALVVAGVSLSDMLVSCSVGVIKDQFCQDCTMVEQTSGGAFLPVAIKARSEEVITLQLSSRLSLEVLETALHAALDGCRKIRAVMEDGTRTFIKYQQDSRNMLGDD